MIEPVYIVDIFREIVGSVSTTLTEQLQTIQPTITGVHYLVGHYTEIQKRLQGLSKMQEGKFDRYPLIALFQDFKESSGDGSMYYAKANLTFMIVYHTKAEAYTEDRYNDVFKPILYPIYYEFIKQVKNNRHISVKSESSFRKDKIDRPNWGDPKKYGNDGNIFSDTLDGIEVTLFELNFKQKCITN